jgi:hypothetical protein
MKKKKGSAADITLKLASAEPSIVWSLRALLNPNTQSPDRLEWIKDGLRKMIEAWDRGEDLDELKRNLGVSGESRRRRAITVKRETTVVVAIIDAALAGNKAAKRVGAEMANCEPRMAQRYWKNWGAVYLLNLENQKPFVSTEDQRRIETAIEILKASDIKS